MPDASAQPTGDAPPSGAPTGDGSMQRAPMTGERTRLCPVAAAIEPSAFDICTPRERWTIARSSDRQRDVAALMHRHRFDMVPVEPGDDGRVRQIHQTLAPGRFDATRRRTIENDERIGASTDIVQLLRIVGRDERRFLLLDDATLGDVGLVTLSDVNRRAMRVWLFALCAALEEALAGAVLARRDESELASDVIAKGEAATRSVTAWEADLRRGVDRPLVAYLGLRVLFELVEAHLLELFEVGRLDGDLRWGGLVELRNQVAHPVRPLVTTPAECERLASRIDRIAIWLGALERMRVAGT